MNKKTIGLGTLNITPQAKKYVQEVMDSNRLSYGPFCRRLENEFATIHKALFGVVSNSGTSALHVALQTLKEIHGWGDGDEVIVPAITFVATSNIVIHNRMQPVFVDVDPLHYELNPAILEKAITSRTRAIIPVHLFGQPCDMDPIIEIAKKYNLKIIEDSCETMFATYKGRSVGTLGDIGCFSTYVAHLLTTGVGGINLTNNKEYAIKIRSLINHGRDSIYISIDDDDNVSKEQLKEVVKKRFSFVSMGHSFRITEMEAALGVEQLEHWEEMIKKRQENALYLIEGLFSFKDRLQLPSIREGNTHSFMMFPIVLRCEHKEKMVNYLEENGIETRDMLPLINQPVYKQYFNLKEEDYPVAKWINASGFYIGCHQGLTKEDLDYIIAIFQKYFEE
jgi:perosamine synthetase